MPTAVEIAIVGASGAGLLAGYLLAQRGFEVALFEQQRTYRPTRRTLIVTPSFDQVFPLNRETFTLHQTPWMTVATRREEVTITLQEPDLIIERSALLHFLYQKVQEAGCRIHLGHRFQGIHLHANGSLSIHLHRPREVSREIRVTRALIAADGVFSTVAQALGLPRPPAIPILQAEVNLPPRWDPRRTQVWFRPHETRYFYWLIPESDTRGVLGLMTDPGVDPGPLLRECLKRIELEPLAHQGAKVALYHPQVRGHSRLGKVDVYFIGDAAGHVKNTTVGGTVTGFWAAQAVVEAIHQGRSFADTARDLYRELRLHWWIRRALHGFSEAGYEALLRSLTPAVRAFLGRRTRDEMAPVLWKTVLTTPPLWSLTPHIFRSLRQPFP